MIELTITDVHRLREHHLTRHPDAGRPTRSAGEILDGFVAKVAEGRQIGREDAILAWFYGVDVYLAEGRELPSGWSFVFKPWASALVGDNAGPNHVDGGFDVLTAYWRAWTPAPTRR